MKKKTDLRQRMIDRFFNPLFVNSVTAKHNLYDKINEHCPLADFKIEEVDKETTHLYADFGSVEFEFTLKFEHREGGLQYKLISVD